MSREDPAKNTLTFAWDGPRTWNGVLPGFIALSLAAHAFTFFLFQIEYPARVTISAPAPSVSLLDPQRSEHQALLRLIEAEDPAPAMTTQSTVPPHLLEVPYRPSYTTVRTLPQTMPEPIAAVQFPPARDPLAVIRSVTPASPIPKPLASPSKTRLLVGEGLSERSFVRPFALSSVKPATEPLMPARFLVGVGNKGEVRFSFLQSSSGDPRADTAAAAALNRVVFTSGAAPMTWSHVTVAWGDDIYRAPAATPQK